MKLKTYAALMTNMAKDYPDATVLHEDADAYRPLTEYIRFGRITGNRFGIDFEGIEEQPATEHPTINAVCVN